jgi:DNA polymerase III gamma/tau subunit
LSRCLQFNLKQMTPDAITARMSEILAAEKVDAGRRAADAGPRGALAHA